MYPSTFIMNNRSSSADVKEREKDWAFNIIETWSMFHVEKI